MKMEFAKAIVSGEKQSRTQSPLAFWSAGGRQ